MWPDLISEVLHRADEDEAVELKPAEIAEKDKTLPPSNTRNSETAAPDVWAFYKSFRSATEWRMF